MRRRRRSFALVLAVLSIGSLTLGSAYAGPIPANAGNLDDGGPVSLSDVLALRGFDPSWIPTPAEMLAADCEATADPAQLVERNGLVLVRGWGHWNCNQALPGSYFEVCLDAVVPSVACNEVLVPTPRQSISLPVDFPCVPGVYITMASGSNPFDTNRANDVDHDRHALVVLPQDCDYVEAVP
ncbi:MAG TPA: hypothetical protein VHN37_09440 [Actinomycetota bacterium]|nr:hypothetical protein [Actinomycetota bacterium]